MIEAHNLTKTFKDKKRGVITAVENDILHLPPRADLRPAWRQRRGQDHHAAHARDVAAAHQRHGDHRGF
jgi:hypothetical protein